MGSIHRGIMGHYWGPGSEKWGPFMESLLRARIQKVGSLHGVILGGQGLNII